MLHLQCVDLTPVATIPDFLRDFFPEEQMIGNGPAKECRFLGISFGETIKTWG
jgi:hypothetical protein